MVSRTHHRLPCLCTSQVKLVGEYWQCATCEAEVKPHQLREWPIMSNGEPLPKPKDSGFKYP